MVAIDPIQSSPVRQSNFVAKSTFSREGVIENQALTLKKSVDPYTLYRIAAGELRKILDRLENAEYNGQNRMLVFKDDEREVIEKLLQQTILNAVNAAKKYRDVAYVGSQVIIRVLVDNSNLVFEITDNGLGFTDEVLVEVGRKSLSSHVDSNEELMLEGNKDHLYNMVQVADKHNWKVRIGNREVITGGQISLAIPLN